MNGKQLLYAYDQGFTAKDVERIKRAVRALIPCLNCARWKALWRVTLFHQHKDVQFNIPISAPKTRRFTTIVNDTQK